MPPPSQQGKFKPRKPAKKVKAGTAVTPGAAGGAVVPDAATSQADAGGRGGGGRGRGRDGGRGGGRGGRGRGRMPMPQGQAFFTAIAPEAASKKGGAGAGGRTGNAAGAGGGRGGRLLSTLGGGKAQQQSTSLLQEKKEADTSEEVVGQLDKAIGTSLDGPVRQYEKEDEITPMQVESKFEEGSGSNKGNFVPADYMYDSDSSAEEEKRKKAASSKQSSSSSSENYIAPSRLPFPVAPLPVGVGETERPFTYKDQTLEQNYIQEDTKPATAFSLHGDPAAMQPPSPFVDALNNKQALQQELESFFLVQFPTRLPPLVPKNATTTKSEDANHMAMVGQEQTMDTNNDDNDEHMEQRLPEETTTTTTTAPRAANNDQDEEPTTAEASTAPVQTDAFDNALLHAKPGRLGKLIVYKSGKTVLVMQGPPGTSAEIRMNVNEGLTCGFEQQAVVIDPMQGQYVKLGNVHKTVVVTPNLGEAFGSS